MEYIKTHKIQPVHMQPGDTLGLTYTFEEPTGQLTRKYLTLDKIEEPIVIDTVVVYKTENEHGLKGVGRALILGEDDGTHGDAPLTEAHDLPKVQVDRRVEDKSL